jgi:hypothetical protein
VIREQYFAVRFARADKCAECPPYFNDEKYVLEEILPALINTANVLSDSIRKPLYLFCKPPIYPDMRDHLGEQGYLGWSSFKRYQRNKGMDIKLFKKLEKEFKKGLKKQKILTKDLL